jgi:nucleoside-diphosphate-sugar epimerase
MIVITGSAGFIGSGLVSKFNAEGIADLILVDDFSSKEKLPNHVTKKNIEKIVQILKQKAMHHKDKLGVKG